jgi:hypothetical protein
VVYPVLTPCKETPESFINPIGMKNTLQITTARPTLKAMPKSAPVLPYMGMYVQVNFRKKNNRLSPFKAQFQTGALAKEAANWDAEWFANYE